MFVPTRRTDDALTPAGKFHLNIAEMVALQSMDDPAWPRDRPYPDAVAGTVAAVAEDASSAYWELAPGAINNVSRQQV